MSSLDILPESWFTKSCLKTQPWKELPSRSESRSVSEHLGDGRTIQVKHRKEASLSKRPLKKTTMPDMPEIQHVYYEPVGTI